MEVLFLFADVRGWKNITIHMNTNKPIKLTEKGQYVTNLVHEQFFLNKTEWGYLELKKLVRDTDIVYIWMNITDYKKRVDCYFLEPFLGNKFINIPYIPETSKELIMDDTWQTVTGKKDRPFMDMLEGIDKDYTVKYEPQIVDYAPEVKHLYEED